MISTETPQRVIVPDDKEYSLGAGITDEQRDQVILQANADLAVQQNTSDAKRFKNVAAFDKWLEKGRTIYTITDLGSEDGKLAGIIWFGNEKLPTPSRLLIPDIDLEQRDVTFAIRTYGDARGQGGARSFMGVAFDVFADEMKGNPDMNPERVWLEVSQDNVPAVTLYQHFGFKQLTEADEHGKLLMVYSPSEPATSERPASI